MAKMTQPRDWRTMNEWIVGMLEERTGHGVDHWNARIKEGSFADEASLRAWLTEQGVTGYPQRLLVMERFGYPDYLTATADELLEGQYRDRPQLRPIYEAILALVASFGPVEVQARKTYVALITPRRTFAVVKATTKQRVDLGLRLKDQPLGGRLESANVIGSSSVNIRVGLTSVTDIDDEVEALLRKAYEESL
jgi:hypothetical protein